MTPTSTLTAVRISAPNIYLNNQYDPLIPTTVCYVDGTIQFNNSLVTPTIAGDNLTINGKDTKGEPTTINMYSNVININGIDTNINSVVKTTKRYYALSGLAPNITQYIMLYRSYGLPTTSINLQNSTIFRNVSNTQPAYGTNVIPANTLSMNDKFRITLRGYASTDTNGNIF